MLTKALLVGPCPPETLRRVDSRMIGPSRSTCSSTVNAVEWWTKRSRFLPPFRWMYGDLCLSCGYPPWMGKSAVGESLPPRAVHVHPGWNIAGMPVPWLKGARSASLMSSTPNGGRECNCPPLHSPLIPLKNRGDQDDVHTCSCD